MQPKPFVWTYTNLHTYDDVCPYKFYRTYILKNIPYVETPQMKEGNDGHTAMELRVGGGKVLPDHMRQYEHFAVPFDPIPTTHMQVEMKVAIMADGMPCGYFDNHVAGRGKIDVAVINDDKAMITDWKFGGNSKYEKAFELEIHGLMLKAKYPQLRQVTGVYVWMKENRVSQTYDLSDFNSTWAHICNIVEEIKDNIADNEFEKRQGPLCGWCDCLDCEFNKKAK